MRELPTDGAPSRPLDDAFGRRHTYLRVSVTDRCNLRCVYCMPPRGIEAADRADLLDAGEIARIVALFARLGIRKVRITGGEPLVRKDIVGIVSLLGAIPGIETLGVTTNGVLLAEHAAALRSAGLSRVNISLDTLRRERFARIALRERYDDVLRGIEAALDAGFARIKINVVVMNGVNDDELADFVEFVRERPADLRFIEFMPTKANDWARSRFIPYDEMIRRLRERYDLRENPDTAGRLTVAREFAIDGYAGSVGFISSMSHSFCGGCDRLRLLADGQFKTCLFAPPELDIRSLLRAGADDETIVARIRAAVRCKPEGHPPMESIPALMDQDMVQIGG